MARDNANMMVNDSRRGWNVDWRESGTDDQYESFPQACHKQRRFASGYGMSGQSLKVSQRDMIKESYPAASVS